MTFTAQPGNVLAQPGNVELGGVGFNIPDPNRYSIPAVGNHVDALKSHPNLVAFWRLGRRDRWSHSGIVDAVNANDSRTGPRLYGQAQGGIVLGGGAALSPKDKLADSTVFGGVNADYLQSVHSAALALTGDLTFLAIVNPTDFANYRMILSKRQVCAPYEWRLDQPGNGIATLLVGDGSTATAVSAPAIPAGVASMIGVTVTNLTITHYFNGVASGSGLIGTQARLDLGDPLVIGQRAPNDANYPFKGSLQDLAILNTSLGPNDMLALAILAGFA